MAITSSNLTNFAPGLYNITAIYQETQNYFSSSETWWVNVTEGPDTQGPEITIYNPNSVIYYTNEGLSLNYVVSDNSGVDSCWYSLNNGENITISGCQNTTFNVSGEGSYTLRLFANDSLGNEALVIINFNVDLTKLL